MKHPLVKEINLVNLVRLTVPDLIPHGTRYLGKCPFHNENSPSFYVNETGFKCFGCGKAGDAIQFLRELGHTWEEALNILEGDVTNLKQANPITIKKDQWKRIDPRIDYNISKISHYKYGTPSWVYTYRYPDGRLFGYVCRWQLESGKQVRPFVFAENGNSQRWRFQGFGSNIPPYLINTVRDTDDVVMIVEGEKAAEALRYIVDMPVVSWALGTSSVDKTDWSMLSNIPRRYVFWADNDEVGHKAMLAIKAKLDVTKAWYVDCKDEIKGFDAADVDWEVMDVREFIRSRLVRM